MLLRQVQARPLQGHHLRALRRRGDAPEGAPRAHGSHRPGRARFAHLVFKGVPSRIGYLLDIAPRELEKVLYFAASIVTHVDNEARAKDLNDLEDKVKAEGERIYVDRDEQLADLEKRLKRRRDFFSNGAEKGFDEDDDFWTRGLATWAEEQVLPPLEDARKLVGGLFLELVPQITTEDAKKIRELVRNAAIRDDRKLTPRELEQVASAAEQILAAIAPVEKDLDKATGAKKGAITKHIHRMVDAFLTGDELNAEDEQLVCERRAEEPRQGTRARQRPAQGRRRHVGRGPGHP